MTEASPDLIAAHNGTDFRVLEPKAFILRIGCHSPELRSLCAIFHVTCAGLLTAWNPFSVETSDEDNKKAQLDLLRELSLEGLPTLNALGVDLSGDWPPEESVFVPGLGLERAKALGAEFGQNALVWAGADAVPQLVLLK